MAFGTAAPFVRRSSFPGGGAVAGEGGRDGRGESAPAVVSARRAGCSASGSPFVALSKGTGFGLWEAARGGRRLRGRDLRGKDGNFHKIHVVGTGSFHKLSSGFDIIKSKEVWNAVKLVRLKREGTVLSFAIEITAFQSRGTYEEEKYRTDRSDGDR